MSGRARGQFAGLVWTLIRTDFKTRYHGTIGGFVWALLKPLTMFLVLLAVFSYVFAGEPQYKLDLIIGLFLYEFFQESTRTGLAVASGQGLPADEGAGSRPGSSCVTSASNAVITLALFSVVLIAFLALRAVRRRRRPSRSMRLYHAPVLRDRVRVFARGKRAVHAVPRSEPGLGGGHAGRVLRRADHLSHRRPAGAAARLPVRVAADADHPVLAQRARRGAGAVARWRMRCCCSRRASILRSGHADLPLRVRRALPEEL